MSDWISVDDYKGVPMGEWIVELEDGGFHIIKRRPNMTIVGDHFYFDHPRVIGYHEIPKTTNGD